MPRAGLSPRGVVDAALAIVDEGGAETVTLAAVAARTGVSTPSLYKHVASLTELRQRLSLRVLEEIGELSATAVMGRSGDAAVASLMRALRDYALAHPHRYALMPLQPLGDAALEAAGQRLLEVILAVIAGYGLEGAAAIHAARRLRATLHGFVDLEAAGGFGLPEQIDETFAGLINMVCVSMRG